MRNSVQKYVIGFVLSLICTLVPYLMVSEKLASVRTVLIFLAVFAVIQVLVQLIFFLHLYDESKPRWQSMTFMFMTMVVVIVVFGSIWIMNNLHYNMMPGHEVDKYIQNEEAITPKTHDHNR